MIAIDDKYTSLGGAKGVLGQPTAPEQGLPDGHGSHRDYQNGEIYWSPETGAHAVYGRIGQKWAELGRESGFLGYPVTDETGTPDHIGRYNHFQHGSIYWTPQSDAHEIHGLIREKWSSLGWERSILKYPITDEISTPDGRGRYNHFQGGSVYWTPQTGAHEVHGLILNKWRALGWERSFLGYPVTDELGTPGPARYSRFEGGAIHWSPYTGTQEVQGVGWPGQDQPTGHEHYVLSLDKFHIYKTRSVHNDTDHVSFTLKMGSQEPKTLTMDTGDVNDGEHLVGLCFGPFRIDDPEDTFVFNWQIVNSDADSGKIKSVLEEVAKILASSSQVTADPRYATAVAAGKYVAGRIVPGNCDGPVAVWQIEKKGKLFFEETKGEGIVSDSHKGIATDSNFGCFSNSNYFVDYSILRL